MKRLFNARGFIAASIPIIIGAGMVLGVCVTKMVEHWKASQPAVKWHHYKMVKDPSPLPFGYEYYEENQVVVDIPVPMPDEKK